MNWKRLAILVVIILGLTLVMCGLVISGLFSLQSEITQLTQERDEWKEMALHYYGRADEFLVSIDSITEIYFSDSTLKQEAE